MNEALQRWREDFAQDATPAFDRLVRGVVPLGAAGQLSLGEIFDDLFAPGDAALDTAAADWLRQHLLGSVPERMTLQRWTAILEGYFRGIATMELPETGGLLRKQSKRIRLWLHGFYEGPDRDPEGAYLMALARAQVDLSFSPLWRRLILDEELADRHYLDIGILGFRKMPGPDGRTAADVPEGLLQALVKLADKQGTGQNKWKQTMRSLFAAYRRTEDYWVKHLAPLLPHHHESSHSRDWLTSLLPGISRWRPPLAEMPGAIVRRARPVPRGVSLDWVDRIRRDPALCDTPAFAAFLDQHRAYAETTGDPDQINVAFNNLSTKLIRADRRRAGFAACLMEEVLVWTPWDPRCWTIYAQTLRDAHRQDDATRALWQARHRFAWNPIVRNELGRILRESGDLAASAGVLREAESHFPHDVVCRNGLAETLREMGLVAEARQVYEQACEDFPDDVFCRTGLADLLIDLNETDAAERLYREVLAMDASDPYARGGLARALAIRSARTRDAALRDEARALLEELAHEGNQDARSGLDVFDDQWQRATQDASIHFRRETTPKQPGAASSNHGGAMADMSTAERLGRAMIALWQAERTEDSAQRGTLCNRATTLLDVPEQAVDAELLPAFVETRGLILLASGDAQKALTYFENQAKHFGRGGWIGIQIGGERARIVLGLPRDADDSIEAPSSQSARFALHVARVIQMLSSGLQEAAVKDLLKALYPEAARFANRAEPDARGGLNIENGAEMLGAYLRTRWFRPAGIDAVEDLDQPNRLDALRERIRQTRTDTFDVLTNATLSLTA
ncbi:MAG: hypothetical protein B7Z37_20290 [Verrucomicrobia bacterium 12-59-8]|nr:MAG: hypothetical protein B7Z37_20290 [Verrucomicrobia bacterium 12-59-8]